MGSRYQFSCPNCTYTAEACGGRGVGMLAVLRAMVCKDCLELVDVPIGRFGIDGPTGDAEYDQHLNRCPTCQGTNLRCWVARRCPKCRGTMNPGEFAGLWD